MRNFSSAYGYPQVNVYWSEVEWPVRTLEC